MHASMHAMYMYMYAVDVIACAVHSVTGFLPKKAILPLHTVIRRRVPAFKNNFDRKLMLIAQPHVWTHTQNNMLREPWVCHRPALTMAAKQQQQIKTYLLCVKKFSFIKNAAHL